MRYLNSSGTASVGTVSWAPRDRRCLPHWARRRVRGGTEDVAERRRDKEGMVSESRRSTRWGWRSGSRRGDGTAAVILLLVVAASFFGTILLLPFGGAGAGGALAVAVDLPLIAIAVVVVAGRRSLRRSTSQSAARPR